MRIDQIMTKTVRDIGPNESADRAWVAMQDPRIHHLVVIERGQVVGVLSERDLGGSNGASIRVGQRVKDLMTHMVFVARPETTVREAANLMRGNAISCLPVLDDARLVGIVTTSDLLELIGCDERLYAHDPQPVASARVGTAD